MHSVRSGSVISLQVTYHSPQQRGTPSERQQRQQTPPNTVPSAAGAGSPSIERVAGGAAPRPERVDGGGRAGETCPEPRHRPSSRPGAEGGRRGQVMAGQSRAGRAGQAGLFSEMQIHYTILKWQTHTHTHKRSTIKTMKRCCCFSTNNLFIDKSQCS